MNRTILVPIDISDSELTQRVISHVEAEAKIDDAKVHFLTVIPSLPYYASLGLAYSAELPAMDDLKAEAKSQLEAIIKKFNLPADRVQAHVAEGSPKDKILEMAKITGRYGDYRLASPGYYYLSVVPTPQPLCVMRNAPYWWYAKYPSPHKRVRAQINHHRLVTDTF